MKRNYIKPEAEKVVFDYAENVTAHSPFDWGGCNNGNGNGNNSGGTGLHQDADGKWMYNDQYVNSEPVSATHACRSTDHFNCYQF